MAQKFGWIDADTFQYKFLKLTDVLEFQFEGLSMKQRLLTIELASFLYIPTLRRKEAWALSPRVRASPFHAIHRPGWLFYAEGIYSAPLLVAIWNCMFYHIVSQNSPKKRQDYHFFLNWYIYIINICIYIYIMRWVNRPSAQKWHLSMSQKPLFPAIHWENIIIFWEIRLQKGPKRKPYWGWDGSSPSQRKMKLSGIPGKRHLKADEFGNRMQAWRCFASWVGGCSNIIITFTPLRSFLVSNFRFPKKTRMEKKYHAPPHHQQPPGKKNTHTHKRNNKQQTTPNPPHQQRPHDTTGQRRTPLDTWREGEDFWQFVLVALQLRQMRIAFLDVPKAVTWNNGVTTDLAILRVCDPFGMVSENVTRPQRLERWPPTVGSKGHIESPGSFVFPRWCWMMVGGMDDEIQTVKGNPEGFLLKGRLRVKIVKDIFLKHGNRWLGRDFYTVKQFLVMLETCCHFWSKKGHGDPEFSMFSGGLDEVFENQIWIQLMYPLGVTPPPSDSGKWRRSLECHTKRKASCHPCGRRNPGRGPFNVSMLFFATETETIESIRFLEPAKKRAEPQTLFEELWISVALVVISWREFVPAFFFWNLQTASHNPKKDVETGPINDEQKQRLPLNEALDAALAGLLHLASWNFSTWPIAATWRFSFFSHVKAGGALSYPLHLHGMGIPSSETYPPKMAFWRWFSFSQGGIC